MIQFFFSRSQHPVPHDLPGDPNPSPADPAPAAFGIGDSPNEI